MHIHKIVIVRSRVPSRRFRCCLPSRNVGVGTCAVY